MQRYNYSCYLPNKINKKLSKNDIFNICLRFLPFVGRAKAVVVLKVEVIRSYLKLLEVIGSYWKLLEVIGSYLKLTDISSHIMDYCPLTSRAWLVNCR